jgi:tRNA A37 threonylcarbamoyladenosine dehydratase
VFADLGSYDLTNPNRQAAYLVNIGRPKVDVLRERVLAVNPFATVAVFDEGLKTSLVHAHPHDGLMAGYKRG